MQQTYRIGHQFLAGKSTLNTLTIIDIYSHHRVLVIDVITGKMSDIVLTDPFEEKDIYAFISNNITQCETEDVEGRFTLSPDEEEEPKDQNLEIGTKVIFSLPKRQPYQIDNLTGYIVRNFWSSYYLITEQGVSTSNRYWKVHHTLVKAI